MLTASPIGVSPDPRYSTLEVFSLIQWELGRDSPVRYIPDPAHVPAPFASSYGPANIFAASRDGSLVAGISKGRALLFDVGTATLLRAFGVPPTPKHPDFPASVALSPNMQHMAVGTGGGLIHIFDLQSGERQQAIEAFPGDILRRCAALAYGPDGRLLAAGRGSVSIGEPDDGWVRVFRADNGSRVAQFAGTVGSINSIAWSCDGTALAAGDDTSLRVWSMQSKRSGELTFRRAGPVYSVAFSTDGLLAASMGSFVIVIPKEMTAGIL